MVLQAKVTKADMMVSNILFIYFVFNTLVYLPLCNVCIVFVHSMHTTYHSEANVALQKIHDTLTKSHVNRRLEKLRCNEAVDWATAEALAIGSLLYQGKQSRFLSQSKIQNIFYQCTFTVLCPQKRWSHCNSVSHFLWFAVFGR